MRPLALVVLVLVAGPPPAALAQDGRDEAARGAEPPPDERDCARGWSDDPDGRRCTLRVEGAWHARIGVGLPFTDWIGPRPSGQLRFGAAWHELELGVGAMYVHTPTASAGLFFVTTHVTYAPGARMALHPVVGIELGLGSVFEGDQASAFAASATVEGGLELNAATWLLLRLVGGYRLQLGPARHTLIEPWHATLWLDFVA